MPHLLESRHEHVGTPNDVGHFEIVRSAAEEFSQVERLLI